MAEIDSMNESPKRMRRERTLALVRHRCESKARAVSRELNELKRNLQETPQTWAAGTHKRAVELYR